MTTAIATGATTKQMLTAPKGAIFIWKDNFPRYAIDLAKAHNREDLFIFKADSLRDQWVHALKDNSLPIVLDHGLRLDPEMTRNLHVLKTPDRFISQEVREPTKTYPPRVSADVMAWTSSQGTGLIIRDESFQVLGRMKFHMPMSAEDPGAQRDRYMALMSQLADLINQKGSTTEAPDAKPSQEVTEEMDRSQALKLIVNLLSDPKTPSAVKKKFISTLEPLL